LSDGGLSASARRDCETSGFVASAAPTANYGLDVHIDTGVLGLSRGGLMSTVQALLVAPLWMALVWIVHALCVMLEWCFTLDLLDSPVSGGVGRSLRHMQQALTDPWIPTVLSVACVLVVYDGLIRRRVADTLGEALLMTAMMVAGLWAIADPGGTVGAIGAWANEASLGTLAVTARGTPAGTPEALGQSMQVVFSSTIEVPWCYLEFGNVGWCRNPAQIEARLRSAALTIAGEELALAGCGARAAAVSACPARLGAKGRALEQSARLLREARSNGAIFLALPANGPARNSINDEGSLLRTICQSSDATDCQGPAAAEAEFRTGEQTWSRLGGLLLIAFGALGMILLLAFIALRLLGASLFSLFYLLIAPGMVLAPALGDGGRAAFRRWAAKLLGAVVSKLLFSFLLGVVLGVLAILASLQALGWWTQWLLMSAFWWGAYARRHQALGLAEGALGRDRERSRPRQPRSVARRVGGALETRTGGAVVRWARERRSRGAPEPMPRRRRRTPAVPRSRPRSASARPPAVSGRPSSAEPLVRQLERIREAGEAAEARGQRRRVAELAARGARVEGELHAPEAEASRPRGGEIARHERVSSGGRAGREAALPGRGRGPGLEHGSVAGEAPLPRRGRGASGSEGCPGPPREIDRELAVHRERPRGQPPPRDEPESSVMRDAREVEAGRKRFLGTDLP
jgi:hypothetical protein